MSFKADLSSVSPSFWWWLIYVINLMMLNYLVILSRRLCTTVSLETYPLIYMDCLVLFDFTLIRMPSMGVILGDRNNFLWGQLWDRIWLTFIQQLTEIVTMIVFNILFCNSSRFASDIFCYLNRQLIINRVAFPLTLFWFHKILSREFIFSW